MNIIEQINEQIQLIERVERVKEVLKNPNFKINWETDIEKMDFQKLRTPISFGRLKSTIRLEQINPCEVRNSYAEGNGIFSYDLPNTLNLLELMVSGERIIPPIFYDLYKLIDGEKMAVDGLTMHDGSHRIWVSSQLNLEEIPILRYDKVQDYCFTPNKWKFECPEESRLVVKSIIGNSEYVFDTNKIIIYGMNQSHLCISEP